VLGAGPHRRRLRFPRRTHRPRSPGQPVRDRPRGLVGGGAGKAGQPQPQHPLRRAPAHGPGAPHRAVRGAGRGRRAGATVSGAAVGGAAARGAVDAEVRPALLVLADGTTFEGEAIGFQPDGGVTTGEVVFNTVMSGYQEVITDPSYAGQVITFTYPHIGNYGVAHDDDESARPFCTGVVVRDLARRPSSWRANQDLGSFLVRHRLPGIAGVDTRRLTRHIREAGAMPCAFGTAEETVLKEAASAAHPTDGRDLVAEVTTGHPYRFGQGPLSVVAFDFGIKRTILRHLDGLASVEVVPGATPADEVLARGPDGVFLSNGPGDPAAVTYAIEAVRQLLGRVPIFGICLGHQLLAAALGATTY